ncbi:MAG: ATP-binding cassette domain-containing protein [Bacteroidales bacterium]|nr:ATP-binding cassette domain-containing protein [Bacteroidales bacterium]
MIDIRELSFAYGKQKVFENINLNFQEGHIYGLLGENGVGKTTLLKIINGLQSPNQGECIIDGKNPFARTPDFLQEIFFLPEGVIAPSYTTPIKYADSIGVFYPNYDRSLFLDLMNEMEVVHDKKFEQLSYGQKKKAMFCLAVALKTKYLLLDEPTNGLDIPSKTDFRRIMARYTTENTIAIISTHQVKDIENLIDPIVILAKDDVLINASIEEIAAKLYFSFDNEQNDQAIYSEMVPGGFINVMRNVEGLESNVLIEPLFNTAVRNRQVIKEIFR